MKRGCSRSDEGGTPILGLDQLAVVYTADPSTASSGGGFTVVANAALRCRLSHPRGGATAQDRAEIAAQRTLLWDDGYVLPEFAQLDVGGVRWNVVAGTLATFRGPSGAESYRRATVVRAV